MHASSAGRVGCPIGRGPHPYQFARCWGKGFINALVAVRCLLRACQRKERGKGRVKLLAQRGGRVRRTRWPAARFLKRPGQYTSSNKELGLRLTGNMVFGYADRTARDGVASGNILYTVDRDQPAYQLTREKDAELRRQGVAASLLSKVNYINEIRIFSKVCLEFYVFDLS